MDGHDLQAMDAIEVGPHAEKRMTAARRCPTCGRSVEASGPAWSAGSAAQRWRIQYWRNPAPKGDAVMELGVFTPEDELLYASPLTERSDQLARAIVAAMNATPATG